MDKIKPPREKSLGGCAIKTIVEISKRREDISPLSCLRERELRQ